MVAWGVVSPYEAVREAEMPKIIRLFNDTDERLTDAGRAIHHDIDERLGRIIFEYARAGYSTRDLESVINHIVAYQTTLCSLSRQM